MTEPDQSAIRRPWCLPCRRDGIETWAAHLGIACELHWEILGTHDQQALTEAVREKHPRGGRVTRVTEQIWIVRGTLRRGGNTVEKTWIEASK